MLKTWINADDPARPDQPQPEGCVGRDLKVGATSAREDARPTKRDNGSNFGLLNKEGKKGEIGFS